MNESVSCTAKVVSKGGTFLATSPEFPSAKGYGPTKEHALDALGQSVRKLLESSLNVGPLEKHPLCSIIREWFEAVPPPVVPFFPISEFMAVIDPLPDFVKTMTRKTYENAALLGGVLVGGDYNVGVHEALYRVAEHPLGFALGDAADEAAKSTHNLAVFSASTRLVGFVEALKAWEAAIWPQGKPGLDETALWTKRHLSGQDESAAAFFLNALLAQSDSSNAFFAAMAKAQKAETVRLKRRKTGATKKGQDSKYKEVIKKLWVPSGFWCLSALDILRLLESDKKEQSEPNLKRVTEDIRALGFIASWKPEYETSVKKVGSKFSTNR